MHIKIRIEPIQASEFGWTLLNALAEVPSSLSSEKLFVISFFYIKQQNKN